MKVIRDRTVIEDAWRLVADEEDAGDHAIVSLARWNSDRDALLAGGARVGVVLRSSESADDLLERDRAVLIAIDFPSFGDGRGYSTARILRSRLGYRGELRAVGDVMRDQIFLLHRCGVDSFAVKSGKDIDAAVAAFDDFSVRYQAAADDERPLYRRAQRSGPPLPPRCSPS